MKVTLKSRPTKGPFTGLGTEITDGEGRPLPYITRADFCVDWAAKEPVRLNLSLYLGALDLVVDDAQMFVTYQGQRYRLVPCEK